MVPSSDHPLGGDPAPWFLVWASARTETVASAGGGTGRFAMGFLERKKDPISRRFRAHLPRSAGFNPPRVFGALSEKYLPRLLCEFPIRLRREDIPSLVQYFGDQKRKRTWRAMPSHSTRVSDKSTVAQGRIYFE